MREECQDLLKLEKFYSRDLELKMELQIPIVYLFPKNYVLKKVLNVDAQYFEIFVRKL